jgi:hypothetical protein
VRKAKGMDVHDFGCPGGRMYSIGTAWLLQLGC